MITTIVNNGTTIKITVGTLIRNVTKSQIVDVEVIKGNIIRIDIGKGPLGNIFIPYPDVTVPATANPDALRDAISDMQAPAAAGNVLGGATEIKQDNEINLLTTLNASINGLKTTVTTIDNKLFYEPLWTDNSGAEIVYKGFAAVGTAQNAPLTAIQRIHKEAEVDVVTWASGNKEFVNRWTDRETLTYS